MCNELNHAMAPILLQRLRAEYRRYVAPRGLEHIEVFFDTLSRAEVCGLVDWSCAPATIDDPVQYAVELWEEWGRQFEAALRDMMDRLMAWWREVMPGVQAAMQNMAAAFQKIGQAVTEGISDGLVVGLYGSLREAAQAIWGEDERRAKARARCQAGDRRIARRHDVMPTRDRRVPVTSLNVRARVMCAGMRL